MKYLDYIKRQIKILSGKTNLIRFPIEKRLQEIEREKKQKQKYMGEYIRPDIPGRKFEPTFIFKK